MISEPLSFKAAPFQPKQKSPPPIGTGLLTFPRYHPTCPPQADLSIRTPTCPVVFNGRRPRPGLPVFPVQEGLSWRLRRDVRIRSAYLLTPCQARFLPTLTYSSPSWPLLINRTIAASFCQCDRPSPQGNRVKCFFSEIGIPRRWRPVRRSGESRNPETDASLRRSPLLRKACLDSGPGSSPGQALRRTDEGDQASCFPQFFIISQLERERTPAFKTRLPWPTVGVVLFFPPV